MFSPMDTSLRANAHPSLKIKARYLLGMTSGVVKEALDYHFNHCAVCAEEMNTWPDVLPIDILAYSELVSLMEKMRPVVNTLVTEAQKGRWDADKEAAVQRRG